MLIAMSQQSFPDDQLGTCRQICFGHTLGRVYTLDLDHFHLHVTVLIHGHFRHRVQDPLPFTIALAVMLLYIFYLGVLAQPETVNAVMSGILVATVVDTAACHDHHIRIIPYIEIIVYQI